MWRSLVAIKAALAVVAPAMNDGLQTRYAEILQVEADRRGFDPIEVVVLVENESHWDSSRVGGRNKRCVGLGQRCLHDFDFCRDTAYVGTQCQAEYDALLGGEYALRATTALISEKMASCSRRTRRPATFRRWLIAYQGFGARCGMRRTRHGWVDGAMPAQTRRILRRYAEVVRIVATKDGGK